MRKQNCALCFGLLLAAGLCIPGSLSTSDYDESSEADVLPIQTVPPGISTDNRQTDDYALLTPWIKDSEGFPSGFAESTPSLEVPTTQNSSREYTDTDINTILMFGIPALALVLLVIFIIVVVKCCHRKTFKPDNPESEDIKSPIFEDDLPSVMEIEMEELDQWMNSLSKNAEREQPPNDENEKKFPVITSHSNVDDKCLIKA
ncbi:transmembrane protein 154 isoform X2 [Ambystoma mexicanum]|uniref:transmembrane protein 154 isoform X2 n=1 Tax=Ambystoma mexicanum TaxID=8296 RepID=UPI0037E85FAD